MAEDTYDLLRRAIVQILGPRPLPERRRQVAADLRALAEQQERMAATADAAVEPSSQHAAHTTSRREPGQYVRLGHEQDAHTGVLRLRVSLGRQIWYDIGSPERIDVQRTGAEIWIIPAKGGAGYQLITGVGLPSCVIDRAGPLAHLAPGRYAASLRAGAIVIGARLG
jgi:hypothetical protein